MEKAETVKERAGEQRQLELMIWAENKRYVDTQDREETEVKQRQKVNKNRKKVKV